MIRQFNQFEICWNFSVLLILVLTEKQRGVYFKEKATYLDQCSLETPIFTKDILAKIALKTHVGRSVSFIPSPVRIVLI